MEKENKKNKISARTAGIAILQDLVRIDSQNPPGDERAIAEYIRAFVRRIGLKPRTYEFVKKRPNIVCRLASKTAKKTLLLTPHIDTVPAGGGWRYPAFEGRVVAGKLYGRGATDCKVNAAVLLACMQRLASAKGALRNLNVLCAFTADEETGSYAGMRPLIQKLKHIDYGMILDADACDIVIAQKGLLHVRVELFGKEAHGAYPDRGVNAIEKAARVITALTAQPFAYAPHPLLIKPTVNIGCIQGGKKVNMVAGACAFDIDIRWLPSMTHAGIIKIIKECIRAESIKYKITVLSSQKPFEMETNTKLIQAYTQVLRAHKIKPQLKASFGATVINFVADRGIEVFATGFGTRGQAHTVNEHARITHLVKGADVLYDYILTFDKNLSF